MKYGFRGISRFKQIGAGWDGLRKPAFRILSGPEAIRKRFEVALARRDEACENFAARIDVEMPSCRA